jgi:hypothetical protein
MLTSANNGTTTINAGTLVANGSQTGALQVSQNGPPAGAGSTGPSTVKSSGYGAEFGLAVPSACTRQGKPFSVTLSIKKTVPHSATSGTTIKLLAKAYLRLNGGKGRTRSITVC